jgi:hypothetical protein
MMNYPSEILPSLVDLYKLLHLYTTGCFHLDKKQLKQTSKIRSVLVFNGWSR